MIASTALVFLLVAAALTLGLSVKRIPEGHVYTLRRMGRPSPRLLRAGTHWVWPLIEHITHRISLAGHALDLDARDESGHSVHGTVYWQVLEPERADPVIDRAEVMIREVATQALTGFNPTGDDNTARAQALKHHLNGVLGAHGIFVARTRLHRQT
ncbi:hypothetical protein [Oleiagrimonas sp.]|jgi:regulator of protease activity HflC (stomatin/prohibitin superfamily)|uniref:SPFH domain-containing protein n=1 Tax=Oleiagrimonas sp. TaxID=2010330 RepID=UPI0026112565|nr:hypothetical protein [Oleiagrimonas sp.]MDA3913908.1 hypothetical protein [Oleiagrimonas sp.]